MFRLAYVSLIVRDYLGKFEGQNTGDRIQLPILPLPSVGEPWASDGPARRMGRQSSPAKAEV